jgi:two-component system, NtrC family, nitrogen regulation sensor histidine kinase GlnL
MPLSLLEHLTTAVLLIDGAGTIQYLNAAAEHLLGLSHKQAHGLTLAQVFHDARELAAAGEIARANDASYIEHEILLGTAQHPQLLVSCILTPLEQAQLLLEFHPIDTQVKVAREERMRVQQQANRELLRNLAHEIKNPLGGLRGAAQLLEAELAQEELKEYTQVIIQEADRLQSLMDRLLTPNRLPDYRPVNIHSVLERVRALILAEVPRGITVTREYDVSLPELVGDAEQLIQAVLNIARNAVQAMQGQGTLTLRTRIARQVTLARRRHRLAIHLQIIDNGPGIPEDLIDEIFYPLVSRRAGGSGLGLTIAQTYINQHHGTIEVESRPGHTCFNILLPLGLAPEDFPG